MLWYGLSMAQIKIRDAAVFLGVSADTVRRLLNSGRLEAGNSESRVATVDAQSLAAFAREELHTIADGRSQAASARNRFTGIVTDLIVDSVMAQVEVQCGPHRIVSLISAESVRELGLEVGSVTTAVVKATNVILESDRHLGST